MHGCLQRFKLCLSPQVPEQLCQQDAQAARLGSVLERSEQVIHRGLCLQRSEEISCGKSHIEIRILAEEAANQCARQLLRIELCQILQRLGTLLPIRSLAQDNPQRFAGFDSMAPFQICLRAFTLHQFGGISFSAEECNGLLRLVTLHLQTGALASCAVDRLFEQEPLDVPDHQEFT